MGSPQRGGVARHPPDAQRHCWGHIADSGPQRPHGLLALDLPHHCQRLLQAHRMDSCPTTLAAALLRIPARLCAPSHSTEPGADHDACVRCRAPHGGDSPARKIATPLLALLPQLHGAVLVLQHPRAPARLPPPQILEPQSLHGARAGEAMQRGAICPGGAKGQRVSDDDGHHPGLLLSLSRHPGLCLGLLRRLTCRTWLSLLLCGAAAG
mmetsp:Transcript_41275/g.90118  ORF Transcript_41275/g.90118 Transcript_41275/m.90118 type:complete len:210 (-) Transcript_41275:448-1077(-)